MPSTPLLIRPLNDIVTTSQAADQQINLFTHFDDPFTTGLTARFELATSTFGGPASNRVSNVVLYDQAGQGAPLSVRNFLTYVNSGAYRNSIIHRSIPNFIIQGGGYVVDGLANTLSTPANAVTEVAENLPIQNEFSAARSNTRGTLAFAKLGGNPNSATSQWFFNLGDNAANLDSQNGGFSVFGEVQSAADLVAVDLIAGLPRFDQRTSFGQGAFSDLPLIFANPSNPQLTGDENLVRYQNISVFQQDELRFELVGNTRPGLLNAEIRNNQLVLDYLPEQTGTAELTVRATNLQGRVVEDTFSVTVGATPVTPPVTPPAPPVMPPTQPPGELGTNLFYDLTAIAPDRPVTARLADDVLALGSSAQFDNLIGLYRIADEAGSIDTDGDGLADVRVGDGNYAQSAILNRVNNFQIRAGSGGQASRNTTAEQLGEIILAGGTRYAPFVIANGGKLGFDRFVEQEVYDETSVFNNAAERSGEAVAYFAFLGANPDGAEHVRSLGNNTFGFEDLPANRVRPDFDFNDAIFRLEILA